MAVLVAVALIVFMIEAQIPLPVAIAGVKLGLANSVTLFALFYGSGKDGSVNRFTAVDVSMILLCRIILGAVFTGRVVAFIYSITGGFFAFFVLVVLRRFVCRRQIWACGAVSAVFHNIGQIAAAVLITGTPAIAAYLPVLIIAGVFTGSLTGLVAQFAVMRVRV